MINAILTMSLTGSAVMLTWLVAGRLFQKRLSAIWHDRFLRVSLFFMLVPLGPLWEYIKSSFWIFVSGNTVEIPPVMQTTPVITPSPVIGMLAPTIPTVTPELPAAPAVPHTVSVSPGLFQTLTVIWLLGAAATLVYKLWCYVRFRRLLTGIRTPLSDHQYEVFQTCRRELKIDSRISVAISPDLPSPLATGLLRPTILLPDGELSDAQLRCVFLHELTHIKRRDLWGRFFALCGVVVHWYNPLMHLLNQKLKEHSEQSCDEQVAAAMSREERLTYGDMLLRLVARSSFGPSEWAVTLSTKESIQQRLSRIVKAGHWTRTDKAVALITAAGLMLCGIAAACSAQEPLKIQHEQEASFETERVQLPNSLVADIESPFDLIMEINGKEYAYYLDNRGVSRLKDALGNGDMLANGDYLVLPTLENGRYPVNSKGETYGYQQLADFVGQSPDLVAVIDGLDLSGTKEINGYIWWEDYFAAFSDPKVAAKYEPSPDDILKDARAGRDAEWWRIPLYDAEHNLIGTYDTYEGKYLTHGNLVWRMQNDSQIKAESKEITELSNHGKHLQEVPYSYLNQKERELLAELPGGMYPKNSKEEYYGPSQLKNYLQVEPDLISAIGTEGQEGFVWWEDTELYFRTVAELDAVTWTDDGYLIPLYDSEHIQIGWKESRIGIAGADAPVVNLNRQTVEAIKAQLP